MNDVATIFAIFIPLILVVGAMTLAIVRVFTQARLEELARRERIAAIERGADPEKVAALAGAAATDAYGLGNGRLRRAHGLLIGSFILLGLGIGLSIIFHFVEPHENHWVIGVLPIMVGLALLGSSLIVWPRRKQ